MRPVFVAILSFCLFNSSYSQELTKSSNRFSWYSRNKSGESITLNHDSSAYRHDWGCINSAFKFGSWSQRGDTITVQTYKYLKADTFSYYIKSDTTPLVNRVHDEQLTISIMDCSGIPMSNFVLAYYNSHWHRKKLKASDKGEVIIPRAKFSGFLGPYDLTKFLSFGIKNISIFLCREDESRPLRLSTELDIQTFIKTGNGLVEIRSNHIFEKK